MKVFVYTKEPKPVKIATITKVTDVSSDDERRQMRVRTEDGAIFTFDTKTLKATIYQN